MRQDLNKLYRLSICMKGFPDMVVKSVNALHAQELQVFAERLIKDGNHVLLEVLDIQGQVRYTLSISDVAWSDF